jgi:hypothetical protein
MRKFLLITFISLMWNTVAMAECIKGNCVNGVGTFEMKGEYTYTGQFKNGKADGRGEAISPNGERYEGLFKDDKFDGQGTYTFANGNKYVGEFKEDVFNGKGTLYATNGDKYVGEFKNNLYWGQGTYTYANGGKYVGEFKDGKENGQGTYTFANGGKYVGEFVDRKFQGQGTQTYANGDYCTGKFNNGKCLGKTVKLDPDKRNKIAEAKLVCEDLGFTPGTEKFAECALKLSTEGSERTSSNRSSGGGGGVNWGGVVDTVERQRQEIERLNRERSNNGNTRVCSYVGNSIVCKDRNY